MNLASKNTSRQYLGSIYSIFIVIMVGIILIYETKISRLQYPSNFPAKTKTNVDIRQDMNTVLQNNIQDRQYLVGQLHKWDFKRLVNFEPFRYNKFSKVCDGPLSFIILIHSSPENTERRNAIRATWGRKTENMKMLFLFGAVLNQTTQDIINEEDSKFHDILQGNFIDTYKNLTYKHVMAFKYAIYYCPQAPYIIKVDDDIFINIPAAKKILNNKFKKCGIEDLIQCSMIYNRPVSRGEEKWSVTVEDFTGTIFPNFCMGAAIIYSWEMAYKIYNEAQKGEYFWIDDIHITGTLAKRFNVAHKELGSYVINMDDLYKITNTNETESEKNFIFGFYDLSPEMMIKLGQNLENKIDENSTILLPEDC